MSTDPRVLNINLAAQRHMRPSHARDVANNAAAVLLLDDSQDPRETVLELIRHREREFGLRVNDRNQCAADMAAAWKGDT